MEVVLLIILLAVIAGVVWWRVKAKNSAAASGDAGQAGTTSTAGGTHTEGALSGGNAAASAEAAATTGVAGAVGFGRPAEPVPPTTAAEEPAAAADRPEPSATGSSAVSAGAATGSTEAGTGTGAATGGTEGVPHEERRRQDAAEWETQWSEASGPAHPHNGPAQPHDGTGHREGAAPASAADAASSGQGQPAGQAPVHHPEYTEPQAPTLPGAETAAVEDADDAGPGASFPVPSAGTSGPTETEANAAPAGIRLPSNAGATETQDRTQSSALVETGADHTQSPLGGDAPAVQEQEASREQPAVQEPPAGHLAAEQPYGEGSASAAADGSGPADLTVKGVAGEMVYYEEGHPEYEQARAEVWFESAAHAEAAGFRAPRRRRI
ncbi:hypothetical protein ACFVYC_02640 [Pseudarthrobacter sp. NPDC058329]|uniref:sunset domain-containing protein n=1 Tax=Pseudarthrobacter sp. NPDC058329 TaxID=3346448 RepID=UPI0036DF2A15